MRTKVADQLCVYRTADQRLGFPSKIDIIYDGVVAETRKSQASFQIFKVSYEALPRMRIK